MSENLKYPFHPGDVLILNRSETGQFPGLLHREIHLWTLSLAPAKDPVERLQLFLAPEERRKASFFKFEAIRQNYIVTQAVLRLLLSFYLNTRPEDVKLGSHKKGKPFLINERSIYFNLSHSHELCVYAFSPDGEVGIDIEKIRELPDIDLLIEKNLTPGEKKYFTGNPETRKTRFFQFWTYKESYLKAIGEGMRLTPENLEFSLEDGTIALKSVNYGFESADWLFKGFSRSGNFTGTLTYTGRDSVIREMSIDLRE